MTDGRLARLRELLAEARRHSAESRNEIECDRLDDYCVHLAETIEIVKAEAA